MSYPYPYPYGGGYGGGYGGYGGYGYGGFPPTMYGQQQLLMGAQQPYYGGMYGGGLYGGSAGYYPNGMYPGSGYYNGYGMNPYYKPSTIRSLYNRLRYGSSYYDYPQSMGYGYGRHRNSWIEY
ncbi:hypothetical protein K501DRAFT_286614 [Backusella circina FSU 941]|nr:hypothetical protein K501DRAFT_286614 [Backusella circina FSU 941]